MQKLFLSLLGLLFMFSACTNNASESTEQTTAETEVTESADTLRYEQETHLKNIKQLTFGGDNAEAYFSFDGKDLVFQATNPEWGVECDQIYVMSTEGYEGKKAELLSTGKGRTTCSYFLPGDSTIIYASTHESDEACPPAPRVVNGKYVWPVFETFDIYKADLEGNIIQKMTNEDGYDAEATVSPDGTSIVFTSTRSGDLELYTMDIDGNNVKQVTNGLGYDGGAFFSPDSKKLIFRSSRPQTEEEIATYKELLKEGLVQPIAMELYSCNVDGSELTKLTDLGGANWAPYFHPSGEKVIFCSNYKSESGRSFNIFMLDLNTNEVEQITFDSAFDSFPMFSPDGKKLVFASNRNNGGTRDTNIFIADWVE